jgi:hypothetical protein
VAPLGVRAAHSGRYRRRLSTTRAGRYCGAREDDGAAPLAYAAAIVTGATSSSERGVGELCESDDCAGARLEAGHCLEHLTPEEFEIAVGRLRAGAPLDVCATTVSSERLRALLEALKDDASRPVLPAADFRGATFSGNAGFGGARFSGYAGFEGGDVRRLRALRQGDVQRRCGLRRADVQRLRGLRWGDVQWLRGLRQGDVQWRCGLSRWRP